MKKIALGLGSNQNDRMEALRIAVRGLESCMTITAISPVYETAPAYIADQSLFFNAALTGETSLSPLALLWNIKQLETELGRTPTFRYGPRSIDIDILFYADQVIATPELTIPHPHMAEREFVLRPLADIAPYWKHPQTGLTVIEMLDQLPSDGPRSMGPLR